MTATPTRREIIFPYGVPSPAIRRPPKLDHLLRRRPRSSILGQFTRRQLLVGGAAITAMLASRPPAAFAADGAPKTLAYFGWNQSQTAAVQRAKVLDALDSGEPLWMPSREIVQTDEPLLMGNCRRLLGDGSSTIYCAEQTADILQTQDDYVKISGIAVTGAAGRTGRGIVVGPKSAANGGGFATYNVLEDCITDFNHDAGVYCQYFGGLTIRGGFYRGRRGSILSNNAHTDAGDNFIYGAHIIGDYDNQGAGFRWEAGGGWYITLNKFLLGYNHALIKSYTPGGTGSLDFVGNSFEGNTPISVDMMGNVILKRVIFAVNNWGVLGVACAVRDFNVTPGDGGGNPWLEGFELVDNVAEAGKNGSPIFDIGCALNPVIGPNRLFSTGPSYPSYAMILRNPCIGAYLDVSRSLITGCTNKYADNGQSTTIF